MKLQFITLAIISLALVIVQLSHSEELWCKFPLLYPISYFLVLLVLASVLLVKSMCLFAPDRRLRHTILRMLPLVLAFAPMVAVAPYQKFYWAQDFIFNLPERQQVIALIQKRAIEIRPFNLGDTSSRYGGRVYLQGHFAHLSRRELLVNYDYFDDDPSKVSVHFPIETNNSKYWQGLLYDGIPGSHHTRVDLKMVKLFQDWYWVDY